MGVSPLKEGDGYQVDNYFAGTITCVEGNYFLSYSERHLQIKAVAESHDGSTAVLKIGNRNAAKRVKVTPSPIIKEVAI